MRFAILVAIGLIVYGQTFHYGFVFDDHIFIVANPYIKNFSNFHLIWHAFPVTRLVGMSSFALNYHFSQLNPAGYHVFNFIIHLMAAVLVWALADLILRIVKVFPTEDKLVKELPFIVALLFLVHPGQTQAVTYITQRFESMATVFYLAIIYVYLRCRLATGMVHKIRLGLLAGVLFMLGMMTKEVVATVPLMILAIEWIFFPRQNYKKILGIFFAAGVFVFLLMSFFVHDGINVLWPYFPSESHDGDFLTPIKYLLTQGRVFLTFVRLLFLPIHQNLDYDYPASNNLFDPPLTLVGWAVITGLIYIIVRARQKFPLIAFGFSWMLITFSINLVPRSNVIFEHKLYLISFGFFVAVVGALIYWIKDRRVIAGILICLISGWGILSFERNKVWADELTLWQDVIKESPNKARVNSNLGRIYGSQGQYDRAIYYFTRSIALNPDNITYEDRGIIYAQQGNLTQAVSDLDKSISMDPNYATTYVKRSWVYQSQQRYQEALNDLARAIRLEPDFPDAYLERGLLWVAVGKYQLALQDFNKAQKLDPLNSSVAGYKAYCLKQLQLR